MTELHCTILYYTRYNTNIAESNRNHAQSNVSGKKHCNRGGTAERRTLTIVCKFFWRREQPVARATCNPFVLLRLIPPSIFHKSVSYRCRLDVHLTVNSYCTKNGFRPTCPPCYAGPMLSSTINNTIPTLLQTTKMLFLITQEHCSSSNNPFVSIGPAFSSGVGPILQFPRYVDYFWLEMKIDMLFGLCCSYLLCPSEFYDSICNPSRCDSSYPTHQSGRAQLTIFAPLQFEILLVCGQQQLWTP